MSYTRRFPGQDRPEAISYQLPATSYQLPARTESVVECFPAAEFGPGIDTVTAGWGPRSWRRADQRLFGGAAAEVGPGIDIVRAVGLEPTTGGKPTGS